MLFWAADEKVRNDWLDAFNNIKLKSSSTDGTPVDSVLAQLKSNAKNAFVVAYIKCLTPKVEPPIHPTTASVEETKTPLQN